MATTASHVWRPSASRVLLIDGFTPGPRGYSAAMASPLRWPAKDPSDILDYQFDVAPALIGNDGDAIATIDVLITPSDASDLSLLSSAADGTRAVLWLQGGIPDINYTVTVIIGTQAGRAISRSILLPVKTLASQTAGNLPLTIEGGAALIDSDGNALLLGTASS